MNDHDRFFERIRAEAEPLRYVPRDEVLTRLGARIRALVDVVDAPLTVSQLLANWFRPLAASVAALALVASIGATWYGQWPEQVSPEQVSIDQISQMPSGTTTIDGEVFGVSE